MKKTEWLSKLNAPDHCPVCGIEISAKQKRKMSTSRFYTYECPGCRYMLYLKGGWLMRIYTAFWSLTTFISLWIIFKNQGPVVKDLVVFVYLIVAYEGAIWFIIPFLPIKARK